MRKRIFCLFFALLLLFCFAVPVFAVDDVCDFVFTPDDISFALPGYDSFVLYKYSAYYYLCYFNSSADLSVITDGSIVDISVGDCVYYRFNTGNVSHLIYAKYGGVLDCSSLVQSGYPRTSTSIGLLKNTPVYTNCPALQSMLADVGVTFADSTHLFYGAADVKDYTVYSIAVDDADNYVVTISTDPVVYNTTTNTINPTNNKLYNFYFDTLPAAETFLRTGSAVVGGLRAGVGAVANVVAMYYATAPVYDQDGNLYFDAYLLPAPTDPVISDGDGYVGLFANVVNAINNLGDNIVRWVNAIPDMVADAIGTARDTAVRPLTDFLDTFTTRFDFLQNLTLLADRFLTFLADNHDSPPTINLNLAASESPTGVQWGIGNVNCLDFGWYARYKPIGDFIISAFLWLGFLWRMYKYLPNLYAGGSMITDMLGASDREIKTKSYDTYKVNRQRAEAYDKRYKSDKSGGKGG